MKVHRYIYTRLSKDLSPTGKNGFQSAFLPGDILASKDVLEIESHIHFPEGLQIEAQSAVFHKQVKNELYMVILRLRPLGEIKDEHGRTGTFLCEGFLIAERDWRPIWRISELIALLAPHQFASLDELLNSPVVDCKTGRIQDLEIDVPAGYWEESLPDFEIEPEEEMLMAMYHVAKSQDRDLAIVVEGEPAAVSARLETCAMFMPEVLRPRIGWDDAFDGGKIFFSPLRIFGYSTNEPTTGRPAVFSSMPGSKAKWVEAEMARFGTPTDPFSHWLLEMSVSPVPRPKLGAMFALSEAMVNGRPTSADMETDTIFEIVNKDAIRKLFVQGLLLHMDNRWAEKLADLTETSQQLQLWLQSMQIPALTALLKERILSQNLTPEIVAETPPEKIIRQGSSALQALLAMWTQISPDKAVLEGIAPSAVEPVLTMLFGRGPHDKTPLAAVATHFSSVLPRLTSNAKVAENIEYYVAAKVPEEYEDLQHGMAKMAVLLGEYGCLHDQPTDWLRLLDRWLVYSGGDRDLWKAAKQLGKTVDLDKYRSLKVFALGETVFSPEVEKNPQGRKGLLQCLIEVHGIKDKKLLDMGYFQSEIDALGSSRGLLGKIKRLFGR